MLGTEIGDVDQDSARFIDNKRISGTISEMVEEALNFCRRNMKVKTIISKETGARTDKTEYPVDALREAILNAVIHRDYSIPTMRNAMKEYGLPEPKFENRRNEFVVTLSKHGALYP